MEERAAAFVDDDPADPVRALTEAAAAVHSALALHDKLVWVAETTLLVTGATVAAVVGFDLSDDATAVAGSESPDIARMARSILAGFLGPGSGPEASTAASGSPRAQPMNRRPAAGGSSVAGANRILAASDLAADTRYRALARRLGLGPEGGCFAVAVTSADGGHHGAILVCHPDLNAFEDGREQVVVALAAHLGVALDNLETINRLAELQEVQREVVHQLQEAVRPPVPVFETAELGVHYLPADSSAPTGGDLYDWFVLPDGSLHLAVVDVMGKGVGATKDALAVTHALRLLILDGCPMESLVARADRLTTAQNPDLVATVIVAHYNPADGTVHLAGGGHPPAVLVVGEEGDAKASLVPAPGIPIGFPGAGSTEVVTVTLGRQDTLVLYTDGLVEATKDILVGLENLTAAAAETGRYPAAHMARALVERSLAGAMRRDDSLALVMRRRVPPGFEAAPPLGAFEYRFSPNAATVPLGRHLLSDWLDHLAVEDAERSDLLLVASELCSNAIRHSTGAPSSLMLRAWADRDALVVEVEDDGPGFELADLYADEVPDIESEGGRGLFVVDALSDRLTVSRVANRTVVRAVRRAVLPGE